MIMHSKYIIILGVAYPYRGGLAEFNERLAREFISEGHRVELVTFTLQYPSFLFPGKTQYSDSPAPTDLKIERKVNSVNPINWISIGKELAKRKADLIIIPYWLPFMAPCFGTIAYWAKRNHHTKVISLIHNLIPHERSVVDKLLSTYFMRHIDAGVTMSKSVLDAVKDFHVKRPCSFSHHPLYDSFGEAVERGEACEYLKLDPSYRYLLFFGLIRDYKGLDWLISAFADERLRNRNLKLIIAGEFYNQGQFFTDLAKRLGVYDDIVWRTNFILDEDVRYYFAVPDLVVQPYKTATQSGVTKIAYHFECPMLVTDVGGLSEIVPDGKVGVVVQPSVDAVADGLVRFFDNPQIDYQKGLREEKQKYSWEKMTKTFFEVYDRI